MGWKLGTGCKKMHTYTLERQQWIPRPVEQIFEFFSQPENLQQITPPWLDFRMVGSAKKLALVRQDVQRIFDFRAETVRNLFQA